MAQQDLDFGAWVSDGHGLYTTTRSVSEDEIVSAALAILERRHLREHGSLNSPHEVADYLRLWFGWREHEVFAAVFLDLCAVVKNVKLAGKSHGNQPSPADFFHINVVTIAAASR